MMGTNIKLQGAGDVISNGAFDRLVAGKASRLSDYQRSTLGFHESRPDSHETGVL